MDLVPIEWGDFAFDYKSRTVNHRTKKPAKDWTPEEIAHFDRVFNTVLACRPHDIRG